MNFVIYSPQKDFESTHRQSHAERSEAFFEDLVKASGVSPEENRKTVKQLEDVRDNLKKLRRKRGWLRFFRVLAILTVLLIPLVVLKMTPKIRALKEEIDQADVRADALLSEAQQQMRPLLERLTDRDALTLAEQTLPALSFFPFFSAKQEQTMIEDFDFWEGNDAESCAVDLLSGTYNENPFLFERRLSHRMGEETYHGQKTIFWTESERGADGKMHTVTKSQTLHASVVKPKPFFSTALALYYCSQGAENLCFSRDCEHLEQKSEKALERFVRREEKKLEKQSRRALKNGGDFTAMSNTDFEVLFDALDRTDEVAFRTLFTPLAQTNMTDLITSKEGFGDDFHFRKLGRTSVIQTEHSAERALTVKSAELFGHVFDEVRERFLSRNAAFFKDLYFDFAPLWAIPIYQEKPTPRVSPPDTKNRSVSEREYESLLAKADPKHFAHPDTETAVIFKARFSHAENGAETADVYAFSYRILPRVDYVSVYGRDGCFHSVAVPWEEYIYLERESEVLVSETLPDGKTALATSEKLNLWQS